MSLDKMRNTKVLMGEDRTMILFGYILRSPWDTQKCPMGDSEFVDQWYKDRDGNGKGRYQ